MLAEQAENLSWSGGGIDARGFPVREATPARNLMRGNTDRADHVSLSARILDGYSILGQAVRKPHFISIHFPRPSIPLLMPRNSRDTGIEKITVSRKKSGHSLNT